MATGAEQWDTSGIRERLQAWCDEAAWAEYRVVVPSTKHEPHQCVAEWCQNGGTLSFASCGLTTLPADFVRQIPSRVLHSLDLSDNPGIVLSDDLFDTSEALTYLDLFDCSLSQLPECVTRVASLEKLNVGFNKLTEIPSAISRCPRLTEFVCVENDLETLPEAFGGFQDLTTLFCQGNARMTVLPPYIDPSRLEAYDGPQSASAVPWWVSGNGVVPPAAAAAVAIATGACTAAAISRDSANSADTIADTTATPTITTTTTTTTTATTESAAVFVSNTTNVGGLGTQLRDKGERKRCRPAALAGRPANTPVRRSPRLVAAEAAARKARRIGLNAAARERSTREKNYEFAQRIFY
jgi:hypothetical protein